MATYVKGQLKQQIEPESDCLSSGEHLEFMDMLQNPTKHMSRTEQRKLKLKEIGVAVDDIEAQIEEDTEMSLRPKTKQKEKPKAESTFKNYGFEVLPDYMYLYSSSIQIKLKLEHNPG